jgi:hypothetical protein
MSATFPEMAFWVIFPLAAFIVVTGWSLTIFVAIKRLREGKSFEKSHTSPPDQQDACDVIDTVTEDGVHFSPLQ